MDSISYVPETGHSASKGQSEEWNSKISQENWNYVWDSALLAARLHRIFVMARIICAFIFPMFNRRILYDLIVLFLKLSVCLFVCFNSCIKISRKWILLFIISRTKIIRRNSYTRSDNLKTRLVFLCRGWMERSEILVKSVDL